MNRRTFLRTATAATSGWLLASDTPLFAADGKPLRVGLIGCGWYGKVDLLRLIQVAPVEVVSLCDVDQRMLADAAETVSRRQKSHQKPRTFGDYRKMLAEKDLDICLVATPDHWHALPMIAAVEAGAHVYVQKPISIDVLEGKAMLDAARRTNRVVQVGTQRRSTPHLVDAWNKVVREGLLGTVGYAEVYCYYHMRNAATPPVTQPPEFFDYDAWTGPAPLRPYDSPPDDKGIALPHRRWWRAFMEYSNGIMGDMCIHMLDMVRWMFDLGWPRRISSTGGILVQKSARSNTADTQTATFEFDRFPVVWNHRSWGPPVDPEYPWGATIYGDKGTLKLSVRKFEFTPNGKKEPTIKGEALIEAEKYPEDVTEKDIELNVSSAVRAHMRDFLQAIGKQSRPVADIEQGHISTASCIMANNAMKLGRTLTWDPVAHRIVGDDAANALLKRPYRAGYSHPAGG